MPRVVEVPVARFDPVLRGHVREKSRAGVRRQNVKGGRRDSGLDGPVYGAGEDLRTVSVQAEDEAAIDHDAEAVEFADYFAVIPAEILALAGTCEAVAGKRFEADKQTSETGSGGLFDQIVAQDRVDGCGSLKDAAHSLHAVEEISRKPGIPEKVIVEKIEMSPRQTGNLGQRIVHELRVERSSSREERVFVAEGAMVGAAARDDNRVRHQVPVSLNEIPTDRRQSSQRTYRGLIAALW